MPSKAPYGAFVGLTSISTAPRSPDCGVVSSTRGTLRRRYSSCGIQWAADSARTVAEDVVIQKFRRIAHVAEALSAATEHKRSIPCRDGAAKCSAGCCIKLEAARPAAPAASSFMRHSEPGSHRIAGCTRRCARTLSTDGGRGACASLVRRSISHTPDAGRYGGRAARPVAASHEDEFHPASGLRIQDRAAEDDGDHPRGAAGGVGFRPMRMSRSHGPR